MQGLPLQLVHNRCKDLGMAVTNVIDTIATQAVNEFLPIYIDKVGAGICPLDSSVVCGNRFPVFQKPRVYIIAKSINGLADNPLLLLLGQLLLGDQFKVFPGLFNYRIIANAHR